MKMLRIPLLMMGLLLCSQGFAATAAQTAQQQKMTTCNAEAKTNGKAGDDRKAFMSTCLKAAPAANDAKILTPQQQKMKDCNATAKTQALKGDARKTFMSTCLKK